MSDGKDKPDGTTFTTQVSGGTVGNLVTVGEARDVHFHGAPVIAGPLATHQLPPVPDDFTGRNAELMELSARVAVGGVTISGVRGAGGIGKTVLALKLADTLKADYSDGQIYLDLKGADKEPLPAKKAIEHVVRAFHPDAKLPDDEAQLGGLYRSVLDGKRVLLLMDNAADEKQARPLLPPKSCLLLVTSRKHFALPGMFAKDLDALSEGDARDLLLKIASRIGDEADRIAGLCGRLPLGLRLAAEALNNRPSLSVSDYVKRLTKAGERLKLVEASIGLSYDLLEADRQALWRRLGVFPETFDAAGAVAVLGLDDEAAQDAMGEFCAFSLVEWNETTRRYRLHDLVRDFAETRLTEVEGYDARVRHARHYKDVLRRANDLYEQGHGNVRTGLGLIDLERSNILAGQGWASRNMEWDEAVAVLCRDYPNAGAYVIDLRLHAREQIAWLETAVMAGRQLGDRRGEGAALGNLGNAYADLGETRRAIELYEQRLAIARETGDRRAEGRTLGNLGLAYAALGETRRAIEYYEQALVIARETGDRRAEGRALCNLGLAYAALGETRRAIEYYEQHAAIARETGDRRGEGAALSNLGSAYMTLKKIVPAIEFYEQQLAITREMGDRFWEGHALGNLGVAYAALGETQRAIELYEQWLEIARETGNRRDEGWVLSNLGVAYAALGKMRQAIADTQAACDLFEAMESPQADVVRRRLAELRSGG